MNAPAAARPRLLAIRGGAVGDFILTLPAIRLLRRGFPHASLNILGYPSIARLALMSGDADEVHSLEHGTMAPLFAPKAQIDPAVSRFFAGFQLVVSWLYDPDGVFRENLRRCGVSTVLQGEHRVDPAGPGPAAAQLAKPLEQLALYLEEPFLTLPAATATPAVGAVEPPPIAIHPGSGSPRKNWGYENWSSTAARLRDRLPGAHFRIISGEAEEETIGSFFDLLRTEGVQFAHERQDLCSLAGTLSRCRLFLGHDSGVSHLAAATGIPCGLLFGPTDPAIWAPRNPGVRILHKPSGSLARISPAEVVELALELLAGEIPDGAGRGPAA